MKKSELENALTLPPATAEKLMSGTTHQAVAGTLQWVKEQLGSLCDDARPVAEQPE